MSALIEWLLGLERIRLDRDAPLSLRLTAPPEAWIQLVGWVVAITAVVYFYRREPLSRGWRWTLISLRMAVIMLVMALVARPALVLRRDRVDPSTVVVLVDRSASMATRDAPAAGVEPAMESGAPGGAPRDSDAGGRRSRWEAAWTELRRPDGLLERLAVNQRIEFWSFGEEARAWSGLSASGEQAASNDSAVEGIDTGTPDESGTDLIGALESVFARTRGGRLAGVIVVGDGRQTRATRLEPALREAAARGAVIHAAAMGSALPMENVAVRGVFAEERAFLRDPMAVRALIEWRAIGSETAIEVALSDGESGEVLASRQVTIGPGDGKREEEFRHRFANAGRQVLRVRVSPSEAEATDEDNEAEAIILVTEEKARVLYVESTPRFEYRYLKNALLRESTIESSCLLLEADAGFRQEGSRPIARFPAVEEELKEYDVVVLGDVGPDDLGPAQTAMLLEFVGSHAGGVAFLAGERHMPRSWAESALERLIPIQLTALRSGDGQATHTPFTVRLTSEAQGSAIFRLEADAGETDESLSRLAGWHWFARVGPAQPGAAVLAVHPESQADAGATPVIVLGRYGAGRTLFLGTDELWRWRRYGGEAFHENFWLQALRLLARGKRLGGDRAWRLETDRRQCDVADAVEVRMTAQDGPAPADVETIVVDVRDEHDVPIDSIRLTRLGPLSRAYVGSLHPPRPGRFSLRTRPPTGGPCEPDLEQFITVAALNSERRHPEADHEFLRTLAARTGGRFIAPGEDAALLADVIPNRTVMVADDIEEPLWDSRLAVAVFVGLIAAEWVMRKLRNLL